MTDDEVSNTLKNIKEGKAFSAEQNTKIDAIRDRFERRSEQTIFTP